MELILTHASALRAILEETAKLRLICVHPDHVKTTEPVFLKSVVLNVFVMQDTKAKFVKKKSTTVCHALVKMQGFAKMDLAHIRASVNQDF